MEKYYPPIFEGSEFHCPYCKVYASQSWGIPYVHNYAVSNVNFSQCRHCGERAIWKNKVLLFPEQTIAPAPHEDLPQGIKEDYEEAASIMNRSPRGAAALLRLCLQQLMVHLGETGKNINSDIQSLVKKGLPEEIQQALDILRVVGNNSVHPGEMDLKDNQEIALGLFELVNYIVDECITRRKRVGILYSKLPEKSREHIAIRDGKVTA
ncbi:DUF4145 domain-containing protein [Bacillus sp. APMAM]|nr:DUF4145 domain-containing protein [Bacillus sp. APMAM]RTZ54377.1 DUF4145 domain-containing protein [Bacillus sp. SAJ1]